MIGGFKVRFAPLSEFLNPVNRTNRYVWTQTGATLRIDPSPSASTDATLWYYRAEPTLDTDDDEPLLPATEHPMIVAFAAHLGALSRSEPQRAQVLYAEYEQARNAMRDRLAQTDEIRASVLYASCFPRAIQTAEIIAPALGVPVIEEPGFGEHDPGPECDGLTFNDFVERYGMPDWESDPHAVSFPGGETVAEFHHRVGATLSRVVHEHRGNDIVVACHGGVIDAAFRGLLRLPAHGAFELQTTNTYVQIGTAPIGSDWQIAGAADFDGDGNQDILWRLLSTGHVWIWRLNGTHLQTTNAYVQIGTASPGSDWQLG